ncbi:hypothetical protein LSUE1_G009528, partial [Lachnellula suecica]
MTSESSASFTLHPATPHDIPRLARIHVAACLPDNAFKLYFATSQEFKRRVTAMLEGQIGEPTWTHIKAVGKETGVLAAWASWFTPSEGEIRERDGGFEGGTDKGEFDFPPGLPAYVEADTQAWLAKATRGQRHIVCKALFTDPPFQKQGMGTALVAYGNRLADEAQLPMFLQASPYGYPVYKKHGFETVQVLDVDLREWAEGAEGDD